MTMKRSATRQLTPSQQTTRQATSDQSTNERLFRVAMAAGYTLRTRVAGWKLFCEDLNIPPWLILDDLPGFKRLQCALDMTERFAFTAEGMLRWFNDVRPKEEPELTVLPLTAERVAASTVELFSVQRSTQALKSHMLVNEASAGRLRETGLIRITPELQRRSFVEDYQGSLLQQKPSPLLDKYLYPSVLGVGRRYQPSTSGSLMGRTSYAASRIFVTRDGSGKARLNTPYFLGLLASVAVHSTSHRNLARSTLTTFNSFGSTVGGDAGINVFHEFEPGIRQIIKGHTPKFVSRVEDRFRK